MLSDSANLWPSGQKIKGLTTPKKSTAVKPVVPNDLGFSERLREAAERAGYGDPRVLADYLGVEWSTAYRWFSGKRTPDGLTMCRMLVLFNLKPEELVGQVASERPPRLPGDAQAALEAQVRELRATVNALILRLPKGSKAKQRFAEKEVTTSEDEALYRQDLKRVEKEAGKRGGRAGRDKQKSG